MIKVDFDYTKAYAKILTTIVLLEGSKKNALEEVGERLAKEMKRTIDEQLEPWPPLSPKTVSIKGHDKMLIDTNLMRDSIDYKVEKDYVTIGVHSDAPDERSKIALIHEHGAPEANIPARPFI